MTEIRGRRPARPPPPESDPKPVVERELEKPLWEQWADQRALATGERLQKVLALRGWGSRRVCEELIAAGRVRVNGEVAALGRRVDVETDRVDVDGVPIG